MQPHYESWVADRESVTKLYVRPVPPRFTPAPLVAVPVATATMAVHTGKAPRSLIGVGFLGACVLVGVIIGCVLALHGGATVAAAPAQPVAAAPKVVVEPIVETAKPAPAAAVAPVVVPATETKVIELVEDDAPAPAPVPAVTVHHHHHAAAKSAPVIAKPTAPKAVEPAAIGTLLVSAKPPCAISVDGRATGLSTPQRALPLAVGHHEITLTNAEQGIQLTTDVTILADQPTRLVQDFTK